MGEPFSRKRFPHTPSQKHSHKNHKRELQSYGQTVGARVNLALALANGQAPPRPCPLRELIYYCRATIVVRICQFVLTKTSKNEKKYSLPLAKGLFLCYTIRNKIYLIKSNVVTGTMMLQQPAVG